MISMTRYLLNIVFVFIFGVAAIAQADIKFKETTIDYGTVVKGSDGKKIFEFTNTGNEPLIITEVFSSCGCTVPTKPNQPIAPGNTGLIEVVYDTQRLGPIRKTITVSSNAKSGVIALKIKGLVIEN